ncbi:MAG: signal peptidase II [Dehalococcoidia bacterium]
MELAPAPTKRRAGRGGRHPIFFGVAALVLALDQATKELVRATLERGDSWPSADWAVRIHHITNTGAAFGVLKDQTGFLIVTTLIGLAAILLYYRYPPFDHLIVPIAMGMMLGGAVGNLADRIRLGRVTDFIDFPLWPAFNLADASVVVGIGALLAAYVLLEPRRSEPQPGPAPPDEDPEPGSR